MSPTHDLIGIRREDLTKEELDSLTRLEAEVVASEDALIAELSGLPSLQGPPFWRVMDQVERAERTHQQSILTALAGVAVVAAFAMLATLPDADWQQRDRGNGRAGEMHLEVAIEGPTGVRPYAGELLGFEERVLFRVSTPSGGYLVVEERSSTMDSYREAGSWQLERGTQGVGDGGGLVSFRPDAPGPTDYRLVLCPPDDVSDCLTEAMTVSWAW